MSGDEGLERLFFELASESRLGVLCVLQARRLRMQEIARKLNLTDTETCRQLQRLSEARLVQKQPDGTYELTGYAKIVLNFSSPLGFISKFKEYFLEHDASTIPCEYLIRIGELSGGNLNPEMMETLNKVTTMLRETKEKIDGTIEVGFDLHLQIMKQRCAEGLKVRWLMQESFLDHARTMLLPAEKVPEIRTTPRIFSHIYITDKAAAFCLRCNNGKMDYAAFFSCDATFMEWASDLFTHQWNRAKPWHPLM